MGKKKREHNEFQEATLTCQTCHQEKPVSEFHRDSKKITGYKSSCKSCRAKDWKKYSETLVRDHIEIHKRLRRTQRVDKSPCESGCELFKICANACQTCAAFRQYTEENQFSEKEIAIDLDAC